MDPTWTDPTWTDPTWTEIDRNLRAIARRRAALDVDEARWLVMARRKALHRQFGYARLEEYLERVLGYGPHAAAERLRVAEELVLLPTMRSALAAGELTYSAVRELSRVAVPETEAAWIAAARDRTLREIEPMVSGRTKGDLPDTPAAPGAARHVVRFAVSGETLALLRDAGIAVTEASGERPDDDALIATLCRAVLDRGDDGAPSRARHQIALTICEACDRAWQDGGGQAIEVTSEVVERARCDAQHLGRVDAAVPARATQDISPSVRRQVWRRDHRRCVVPGCRSTRFLDLHHIAWRRDGGDHSADNLCLTCTGHHLAVHEGRLVIRGRVSTGLMFLHADGRPYGAPPPESAVPMPPPPQSAVPMPPMRETPAQATLRDAVDAIRRTGYSLAEARAAVDVAVSHVGSNAGLAALIRAAFAALHPRSSGDRPSSG